MWRTANGIDFDRVLSLELIFAFSLIQNLAGAKSEDPILVMRPSAQILCSQTGHLGGDEEEDKE